MANLFYRGVNPDVIESMSLGRLRFYDRIHELMVDAEKRGMRKK